LINAVTHQRVNVLPDRKATTLTAWFHERGHLDELLGSCPPFTVLAEHVRAFADLLTTRRGADLNGWMSAVEASDLPALHAFVRRLRKDLDAVVAGLSARRSPWLVRAGVLACLFK
jgi:hypothetical protein